MIHIGVYPPIDRARFNVPSITYYRSCRGRVSFYGSNDATNSVKALKEDRSQGLGFNAIRSTPPCSQWYVHFGLWQPYL